MEACGSLHAWSAMLQAWKVVGSGSAEVSEFLSLYLIFPAALWL
jgi:hypothetical protein